MNGPRAKGINGEQCGASLTEYAVIVALIALVAIPALTPVQRGIQRTICRVAIGQFDVHEYFEESSGRCRRGSSVISGYFW